jgi:uncharacterized membrane protein YczE
VVIPVTFFLAVAFAVVSWSLGQGGPVAGLVFVAVLMVGILVKISLPLVEKANPYLPERLRR